MPNLLIVCAILGYGLVFGLVLHHVSRELKATRLSALSAWLWLAALLCHTASLSSNLFTPTGLDLGFYNALAIVAWFVSLFLLVSAVRHPMEALALVVLPLAIISLIAGVFLPEIDTVPLGGNRGLEWHVLSSLLAFSMLSLAAAHALLLSYQDRRLHNHQFSGWVRHLPPLQYMEKFLFQLILLGYTLLSLALLTGWLFIEDLFAQQLIHKTTLSLIAWSIFTVLLAGRLIWGWRGRKAVNLTLWGFGLLLMAYFGSKLVLEIILQNP